MFYPIYARTVKSFGTVRKNFSFSKIFVWKSCDHAGKGNFAKIKGSICNAPTDTSNLCNVLARPADSNVPILVKLKRHLNYRGHVIFELVRSTVVYEAIRFLKDHNELYSDVLVNEDLKWRDDQVFRWRPEWKWSKM